MKPNLSGLQRGDLVFWKGHVGLMMDETSFVHANGHSMTVPGSQTTAIFSKGFDYNRTYSFRVYAVGSGGGWSGASNTVTATLLNDTTPAAKPVVSSTATGPTHKRR